LNTYDRKILSAIQKEGRQSLTELAEKVGISLSACHRRIKALEQSGVIRGYHADINAKALGIEFSALVFVTLAKGDQASIHAFEEALKQIVNVVEAQRLFGEPDYLLKVMAMDLADFQSLYDKQISGLPNVQRLTTTLVMKNVINNKVLPLK